MSSSDESLSFESGTPRGSICASGVFDPSDLAVEAQ